MDGDGVWGFGEEDAVVAGAEAEEAFILAGQRLDPALAGFGVAVDRFQNVQGDGLGDGADLARNPGFELDLLHGSTTGRGANRRGSAPW